MPSDRDRDVQAIRAESRLRQAAQVEREKQAAWSEIAATTRKVDENTARLKALRMAKEQADSSRASAETRTKAPPKRRHRP